MSDRPKAHAIDYGWLWQPVDATSTITVERLATLNGRAVLAVRSVGKNPSDAAMVEIAVSKGGRTISVYPVRGDVRLVEGNEDE